MLGDQQYRLQIDIVEQPKEEKKECKPRKGGQTRLACEGGYGDEKLGWLAV